MPQIDLDKIKDGVREAVTSDAAKLIATAVVTTGALVASHLVIKRLENGQDPK